MKNTKQQIERIEKKNKEKPEKLESIKQEQLMIQIKEDLDKENARKHSIKEGKFAGIAQGAGHSYISPFAIAAGATNAQVGLLSTFPQILRPLAQLFGARLIEREKRKKVIVKYVLLEAFVWFLFVLLGILIYLGKIKHQSIAIIGLYCLSIFIGNLAAPAWFSWMGDIVPEKIRGRYFAKRNKLTGAITLIVMLSASFLLDLFKTKGLVLVGFSLLFLISGIARSFSGLIFKKQYEPELKLQEGYYFSFFSFFKKLPFNNFGRFTIFVALVNLTQFIAGPFFAVYMLKNLGLSYLWFTLITISGSLFNLASLSLWGNLSDKYGNKFIMTLAGSLIPILPILWLISPNPFYLMIIPGFMGGIAWAGFNLGAGNFIYSAVTPERRAIVIAYHNIIISAGMLIGGLIGSLVVQSNIQFMPIILFIFLLSGILRAIVIAGFLPIFQEPHKVKVPRDIPKAIIREIKPQFNSGLFIEPSWLRHLMKKHTKKN